ncbi:MAG TPA: hypothetical protein VHG71_03520 [Verrucomicrobiae bacterium]|nr:hypothetical protein [Verrucomicrobiae bacterium]
MNYVNLNLKCAVTIVVMVVSELSLSLVNANGDTVGIIDPPSANDVDIPIATFSSSSGNWGNNASSSIVSITTFQEDVGTAFANNLGGVENFEGRTIIANSAFTVPYGTDTLTVSPGSFGGTGGTQSGGRTPISGTNQLLSSSGTGMNFSFVSSNPNHLITGIGFVWIERNTTPHTNVVTTTVTLDNGDTITAVGTNNTDSVNSDEDIFFGFITPTNRSITGLNITTSQNQFNTLDDLAFIMNGGGSSMSPASILSFKADKTTVVSKEPFTLSWTTAGNPTSLILNPGNIDMLPFTTNGAGTLITNWNTIGTNIFTLGATNAYGASSATASVAVVRTLSPIYDPKWDANDLDQDAAFFAGTGSGDSSTLIMNEAAARQFFANSYLAGQGGVENFETRPVTSGQPFYIAYGTNDSLLMITGQYGNTSTAESDGRIPISGSVLLTSADGVNLIFNFTPANPNDKITQVAIGVIERNRTTTTTNNTTERVTALVTGSAVLDNGDTIIATNMINTDDISSDEDTFFGFNAPAGRSITNLTITANTIPLSDGSTPALFPAFDDLAFAINNGGHNNFPSILEYVANKTTVVPKEPITFNWIVTTNLTSLTLNPGGINVLTNTNPTNGIGSLTLPVSSTAATNVYSLVAVNDNASQTQSISIDVVNTLVGIIDPPATSTNENDIDKNASFVSGSGLGDDSSLVLSLDTFRTSISNAFAMGVGGVENFEARSVLPSIPFYEAYGINDDHLIISGNYGNTGGPNYSDGRIPLSGTNQLFFGGGGSNLVFNLELDNSQAKLSAFGFGLIERNLASLPFVTVTAMATFENGDTLVESSIINSDNIPSDEDTWFGFQAPLGHSITNITINLTLLDGTPAALYPTIDDIAFIVSQPSVPRITDINCNPLTGNVTLTWTSDSNASYSVEATDTLSEPTWSTIVSDITSGGTTTSYTETHVFAGQRFYRVIRN